MGTGIKKILITRSASSAEKSFAHIQALGKEIIYFPTIETIPLPLNSEAEKMLSNYKNYDYLIFTSANGVKYFFDFVSDFRLSDERRIKVAAVGTKTAEAVKFQGIKVDIIPDKFSAEGLLEVLSGEDLKDKKVLIPASENSRDFLMNGLRERGAEVVFVPIYKSVTRKVSEDDEMFNLIKKSKPDVFVFTSPSSVRGFLEIFSIESFPHYFSGCRVIAIGNVTENYLRRLKIYDVLTPEKYTLDGVAQLVNNLIMSEG